MNYLDLARRVIDIEIAELRRMGERLDVNFIEAVQILESCLRGKHKIVVCGVGKSGSIARKFAATLNSTGATCVSLNAQDALHGDLGVIDEGDVVILMSYSGATRELIDLLPHLRQFNASLIGITGNVNSVLGRHSDVVLDVKIEKEACPLGLAPTSSTTSMMVMCDAVAMVLLEVRGFKSDDFAKYHPSGALGRALLTKVKDVMRTEESMALIRRDATITDALQAITQARAGAAVIVDDAGKLQGIFTHGDFVRAFQKNSQIAHQQVADFMTVSPVIIGVDQLATELIALLKLRRVDDVVVIDSAGSPVGLVDTQDLTRLNWL